MIHFPTKGIFGISGWLESVCLGNRLEMISQIAGNEGLSAMGGKRGRVQDGEEGIMH